ncbi:MAG: SUMF1/EgtB/PvdO family nonheme iron enzyme [Kiritimatiellae bacterium]|nr:SUMF1/EgtB/PvdO family nonheme iron enzyme [Kiritimatiellia bacterium]
MKMTQGMTLLAAALLLALSEPMVRAQEFAIESFDSTGRLTFNEISTAETYRVEWRTNLLAGAWSSSAPGIEAVSPTGSGTLTVTVGVAHVSCFYRVVATVTNAPPSAPPSGMVLIPAGTNSGTDPDFGVYSLTVGAFYMDQYEVTKALWDEVYTWAIANGYSFDNAGSGKASNHPVHTVNWYDCVKWCNARSEMDGREPCYTVSSNIYKSGQSAPDCILAANGYRLPTNDEWKYAARGGLQGKRFPWGDTVTHSQANYYSSSNDSYDISPTRGHHPDYNDGSEPYTSPVGNFEPNGFGLYDIAGNVWEWCNDAQGSSRYIRGGCWTYRAIMLRCRYENWDSPEYSGLAGGGYGFRAVCR